MWQVAQEFELAGANDSATEQTEPTMVPTSAPAPTAYSRRCSKATYALADSSVSAAGAAPAPVTPSAVQQIPWPLSGTCKHSPNGV